MKRLQTMAVILIVAIGCFSCHKEIHVPYRVSRVLDVAGENRGELVKVLEHYQDPEDSLKLRAAYFLLENLDGKRSFGGENYEHVRTLVESYASDTSLADESLKDYGEKVDKALSAYNGADFELSDDVKHLTADFLIRYIDAAFQSREYPWSKGKVSFEQFCHYILPYKIGDEPVEDWRHAVLADYRPLIDSLVKTNKNYVDIAKVVNAEIARRFKPRGMANYAMSFGYSDLKRIKYGSCYDGVVYTLSVMRALGIPVCMDFTPAWGNRNGAHQWAAVMLPDGKSIPFDPTYNFKNYYERFKSKINRVSIPSNYTIISKIYRPTYDDEDGINIHQEELPSFFRQHMLDVTDQYTKTYELSIPLQTVPPDIRYAYIFEFDAKGWIPVQMAPVVHNGEATFKKLSSHIVYLPGSISSGQVVPMGNAFILDDKGNMEKLIPSNSEKILCTLFRKYPYSERMISYADRMRGGKFQGADDQNFSKTATLYTISQCPDSYYQEITLKNRKGYRYFRYVSPDSCYGDVAEIEVYTLGNNNPIYGNFIGSKGCELSKAFDKDKSTYFATRFPSGNWLGMDFGKPVVINKIRYLPRNDGNTIEVGDEYELFYWKDAWQSLGVQKAKQQYLKYSVPAHALLWLKNKTKGKEEPIFTYEHGKQVWW